jgi:hypothetical protein
VVGPGVGGAHVAAADDEDAEGRRHVDGNDRASLRLQSG